MYRYTQFGFRCSAFFSSAHETLRADKGYMYDKLDSTGLKKKNIFQYPFQMLTNIEPEVCAEHSEVFRFPNLVPVIQ